MVKQLSVFLENSKGRLASMTRALGDAPASIFWRFPSRIRQASVYSEPSWTTRIRPWPCSKEAGYTVNTTEVLARAGADSPGGLGPRVGPFE